MELKVNLYQRLTEEIKSIPLIQHELLQGPKFLKMRMTVKGAEYVHE